MPSHHEGGGGRGAGHDEAGYGQQGEGGSCDVGVAWHVKCAECGVHDFTKGWGKGGCPAKRS